MKKLFLFTLLAMCLGLQAQTTNITVMTYNILNFPNGGNIDVNGSDAARVQHFTDIVEAAGADVIIVQEIGSLAGADLLLNELNANGTLGITYNRAPSFYPFGFNVVGNMMFYNDDLLNLVSQTALPINNTAVAPDGTVQSAPRGICEYIMNVVNPDCPTQLTEIRFFDQHLKAGQGSASGSEIADSDRRDLGALDLMDYVNTLALTVNVVVAGDFNFYGDNVTNAGTNPEPAYTTLVSGGNTNPLIDAIGGWTRNTTADQAIFTQSTRGTTASGGVGFNAYGNSGIDGGKDDRFDLIFFNGAVNTNANFVQYVGGSYQTFGATGVGLNNEAIDTDILYMSDHYPVILDLLVTYDPLLSCVNCAPSKPIFVTD